MGSQRPKMAFLAVLGALKTAHRAGGYAGWLCIPRVCDLRCPEHHLIQLKKSVKRNFRGQELAESDFRVRHDAVVFRPNRRHEQNRNGLKPLKPGSFGVWGSQTARKIRWTCPTALSDLPGCRKPEPARLARKISVMSVEPPARGAPGGIAA